MQLNLPRRRLLLAAALAAAATASQAQPAWPSRPIRLIIGVPAGVGADVFARIYADKLSKALGQPVTVDNRVGAGGNLAQDAVAKSAGDGHTLLYAISNSFVTNPYVYRKLPFDVEKDFVPVGMTAVSGLYLVANPGFPAKTLPDLIRLVRSEPGKYSYASYGVGGFPHLMMELILDAEKLSMVHVPYRTGGLADVVGGAIPISMEPPNLAIPFIRDGRVQPIAYLGAARHPATPDLPTLAEVVPSTQGIIGFHGVWAPAGTPRDIVLRLNQALGKASRDPEVQEKIRAAFSEPASSTPEEMAAVTRREQARWSALIKSKNIQLD